MKRWHSAAVIAVLLIVWTGYQILTGVPFQSWIATGIGAALMTFLVLGMARSENEPPPEA